MIVAVVVDMLLQQDHHLQGVDMLPITLQDMRLHLGTGSHISRNVQTLIRCLAMDLLLVHHPPGMSSLKDDSALILTSLIKIRTPSRSTAQVSLAR